MSLDILFFYSEFINLSTEIQFFYICLTTFFIFIIWQVSTNPIAKIHSAASAGNTDLVRTCLQKGVDPDLQTGNGVTPLYLAATNNHKEAAKLLIYYGADVNQGLNEEYGRNPLLAAAIGNYSEFVELLVDSGAKTGIHLAALQGDIDVVRKFLKQQKFSINSNRNHGMYPISLATMGGHLKIVELLLDKGAIIDFLHAGETPLYQAVAFNHLEVVDLLLDRDAEPDRVSALHIATRRNYLEMVNRLIARGADINYQGNSMKTTALHIAAGQGLLEIAEVLIANGAQVNARSKFDASTPLHNAAQNGFIEVAKLLLASGAEVDARGGFNSTTPLLYASQEGHLCMVDLLIRNGANVNIPNID